MTPPTPVELPPTLAGALAASAAILRDSAAPLDPALRQVCEISAVALGVERVSVWLLGEAGRALRCLTAFERTSGLHCSGTTLRTADFPRYFGELAASGSIPAAEARLDPRTSELAEAYLTPLGIAALLDTPIARGQVVLGVVCHEHSGGPRAWSDPERHYAEALAPLLAARLHGEGTFGPATPADRTLLDQLAAGVAHDFKNLLTVILGYADIVGRRATLAEPDREALRRITEAADRGSLLADDLMLIASDRPRRTRVISPARVIEAALPLLRSLVGPGHELHFEAPPHDGRVFLDPSSLERVVTNLVVNARDASPGGGPITVRVRGDAGPPGQPCECIEVADRGTGIDPAARDRLFEPFFSTKRSDKGTGLGLAIVKQIVDRAGGHVRVESAVGQGTTFRVCLPRVCGDLPANS